MTNPNKIEEAENIAIVIVDTFINKRNKGVEQNALDNFLKESIQYALLKFIDGANCPFCEDPLPCNTCHYSEGGPECGAIDCKLNHR